MNCPGCGVDLVGSFRKCPRCGYDLIAHEELERANRMAEATASREEAARLNKIRENILSRIDELRRDFLSTTGSNFEGFTINKYIGIYTGEVVLGTGFFSEFSAAVNDLFGLESRTMSGKVEQVQKTAITKLIDNCIFAGANAVIGVDVEIMSIGNNMVVASASGTAVIIEKATKKVLPIRSKERHDIIKCPECGKIQKSENKTCESCGVIFI